MTYEEKYIKYKLKYLKLQQSGGAFPFYSLKQQNKISVPFTIMAELGGDTLDRVNERRSALGLSNIKSLHITLLQIFINSEHPYADVFTQQELFDKVNEAYNVHLKGQLELVSSCGKGGVWEFLGHDINNQFWTRVYSIVKGKNYNKNIYDFRMAFYNMINTLVKKMYKDKILKVGTMISEDPNNPKDETAFDYYGDTKKNLLYAINTDQYVGFDNWKPHISILTVKELASHSVYQALQGKKDEHKTSLIKGAICKSKKQVKPISNISFGKINGSANSFSNLLVSFGPRKQPIKETTFDISK
jgi:hypothetical protein